MMPYFITAKLMVLVIIASRFWMDLYSFKYMLE